MYKVIVVDDETWICKLIRKIVDWEASGFHVIADAQDGQNALKMIEQQKPDLVVTDIRMPGLDGIGLIKAVREKGLDTEFVIISGYSDFEYAQSAVSYNVLGYLLKPISKEDLDEILQKVKQQIRNKQTILNKIEASDTYMLEHDLWKVIDRTDTSILIETLNERYNTHFAKGQFRIAIFRKDNDLKNKNGNAKQFFSFLSGIKDKYKDLFFEFIVISSGSNDRAVAVMNYDEKRSSEIKSMFSSMIESYHSTSDMRSSELTIGLGCETVFIGDISRSYDSASNAVKARVSLGTGRVIDVNSEAGLQPIRIAVDARREKKLATLFDVFDMDGAADEIARILESTEKKHANSHLAYNHVASNIINILFTVMQRKGFELKGELSLGKAIHRIDDCSTKAQIKSVIYQMIEDFSSEYAKWRQNNGSLIINEIKSFVAENYMREIGLDDVAKLVCLNPTYVSEIFKKNMGENFSEYLIGYRIGIAKELLKDVRYKIIDVSSMVGYKDAKYFSRLFKDKVGVNPTNYRKLYA